MSFFKELKRRNVFRVGIAYLAGAWLLVEVADTLFPAFGIPDWGIRFVVIIIALGFPPALVISWIYEMTPDGLKREEDVVHDASIAHITAKRLDGITISLIIAALAFILADRFWLSPRNKEQLQAPVAVTNDTVQIQESSSEESQYPPDSIAVLPFVNMSSDPEQEYFSDGISEELLNLLAKIPELQVISRSSAFSFKGKDFDIPSVAEKLNVAYVLEGSVRKAGNQVRITAQLIEARSDTHLWSETYDRQLDDIFAIQDEIAVAVVGQLKVTLLGEKTPQAKAINTEAYAIYLQGKHLNSQHTQQGYEESELLLKEALSIDPEFAPAWRELGITYRGQEDFDRPRLEALKLAQDAFEQALALDPNFAPVYASLSLLARSNFEFAAADEYLQEALKLNDDSGFPHGAAASLSRTFGRFDRSIDLARKSITYSPTASVAYSNLGYSCYYARRYNEAASAFRKAILLNPERTRPYVYLGRVLLAKGKPQEALEVIQKAPDNSYRLAGLAMVHHVLGEAEASDQELTVLTENWSESMAFQIAEIHAFRGDKDMAFEWLERAMETRDGGLTVLLGNPVFDELTSDARYQTLVRDLGLLEYWQEMKLSQPETGKSEN